MVFQKASVGVAIMGKIVHVVKTKYGKIDWSIVKGILMHFLNKKIIIKENNVEIKIDRKFVKEYIHSNYSLSAKRKIKNFKERYLYDIVDIRKASPSQKSNM